MQISFFESKTLAEQVFMVYFRKASTFERSRHCTLRVLASPLVGAVRDGPDR